MIDESIGLGPVARRLTAICVLASSLSGCLSEVSSSVRETAGAPLQRLRLVRSGVAPIAGTFRQDGHTIVGRLTLTPACNAETFQRVKRQQVTDAHTNRSSAIGWLVAGGVIAAIGTGLLAASGDADKQVSCGEQQAGDRCASEESAMQELGLTTLLTGLATGVAGGIFLIRKPQIETKDLPEQEVSRVTSQGVSCASAASLEGIGVAIELPGNGTWSGRATADGTVRIEVQPTIPMPEGAKVQVLVQSVSSTFASSVSPGDVLGEVTFEKQRASVEAHATGKLRARDERFERPRLPKQTAGQLGQK